MRRVSTSVGVVAALSGLALTLLGSDADPGIVDGGEVLILGWLAVVATYLVVRPRLTFLSVTHLVPSDVERGTRVRVPRNGLVRSYSELDDKYTALTAEADGSDLYPVARNLVRTTLQVEFEYGPGEATRRVERGTWTDDPVAAWFLGDENVPYPSSALPTRLRLRGAVDPDAVEEYAVRRTIVAIERLRGGPS